MVKVVLIGCGAIGGEVIKAFKRGHLRNIEVVCLYDINPEKALELAKILGDVSLVAKNLDEVFSRSFDVIVEAASPAAVKQIAERAIKLNKTLVIMSSGAFLDSEFFANICKLLEKSDARIIIPSGAIGGVDIANTLALIGGKIKLISTKNKKAFLKGKIPENIVEKIKSSKGRVLVFSGKASEAIKLFPTMINVGATISMAAKKDIEVEIWADPEISQTIHKIMFKSDATTCTIEIINKHHPENPRTSYLAPLSLIRTLQKMSEKITAGT